MVELKSVKTVQYATVELEIDGQLLAGSITMHYENYGQDGILGYLVSVRLNTLRFLQRVYSFTPLPNQYCGGDPATAFIAFVDDAERVADLRAWLGEGQSPVGDLIISADSTGL